MRGASDFIEVSSCFAAEAAEPGLETTEKADSKVPAAVSPIAHRTVTPTESMEESLRAIADGGDMVVGPLEPGGLTSRRLALPKRRFFLG